jgi:hypothetical protein
MLFLTRWFGVTGSDAERNSAREQSDIKEISESTFDAGKCGRPTAPSG